MAQAKHRQWLDHWASGSQKQAPPPAYKDCLNCPLRAQADNEKERRDICGSCPWTHLPDSPNSHFYFVDSMATYPDYLLERHFDDLTGREHRDIAYMREFRQELKEAQRMNAMATMMFGASLG